MALDNVKSNFDLENCEQQVGKLLENMQNSYKGSKGEFDESIRKMARLYKTVRKMVPKKVLTAGGMMVLNHYMKGSADALNRYLDMNLDKGKGANKRKNVAEYAIEKLDELADKLDKSKEELEKNDKPAIDEIKEEVSTIKSEMILRDDIKKDGKKYPDAMKEYSKLESQWTDASNKKQTRDEKEYTDYASMEKMKHQLEKTQTAINNYLRSTEGKAQDKATRKRVETMLEGKASIERQLRKIEDMENAKSKEPVKEYKDLNQNMQNVNEKLNDLSNGKNGTDFTKAREAFELVTDMTNKLAEKGPDYKPTQEELESLNDAQAKAEHLIDNCLYKTADAGDNSEIDKQQTEALEEAKNALYDIKRTTNKYRDDIIEKDAKVSDEEIEKRDEEVLDDLKKNGRSSFANRNDPDKQDYDDVVDKYEKSAKSSKDLNSKEKPSKDDYDSLLKELNDVKSSADKYLKEKMESAQKGNPEFRRKLESVRNANDANTTKINKFSKEKEDLMSANKEELNDAMDVKNNSLKANQKKAKNGSRTIARATTEANKALSDFSKKPRLSPQDKQGARRAIAAMVLEAKLKGPEGEMLRKQIPANKLGKAIEQLANSKEFKEILPDKAITPSYCAKIASGKTDISKLSNKLSNSLKVVAKSEKIKQKHFDQIRKKELNLEAPKPKNPGYMP